MDDVVAAIASNLMIIRILKILLYTHIVYSALDMPDYRKRTLEKSACYDEISMKIKVSFDKLCDCIVYSTIRLNCKLTLHRNCQEKQICAKKHNCYAVPD